MNLSLIADTIWHRLRVIAARARHEMERFHSRDPLLPPSTLHSVGLGGFRRVGDELLLLLQELGELRDGDRVLDIGCGTGRLARPLAKFLREGSYDGMDVVEPSVEWCRSAYQDFPHFRFHHADLFNQAYNRTGSTLAAEYRFPFADASFDFVILTSVFTHMLACDTRNYLHEISRLLSPGGRVFITAFILDEASRKAVTSGRADFTFRHEHEGCYADRADVPEGAVAYDGKTFDEMLVAAGLTASKFVPGTWRGGEGVSYQDVMIVRPAPAPAGG